jgi:hypothetical protein
MKTEKVLKNLMIVSAIFFLSACSAKISESMSAWPIVYYPSQSQAPVVKGSIATLKDTLDGFIRMINRDYFPIIPNGSKWISSSVVDIKLKDIERLNIDSIYSYKNLEFHQIPRFGLFRLIAKKNNVAIYDGLLKIQHYKNKMLLVTPKSTVKLYSWVNFNLHFGDSNSLILKFINKRYGEKLHNSDFKNREMMIDYILDKESAISTK